MVSQHIDFCIIWSIFDCQFDGFAVAVAADRISIDPFKGCAGHVFGESLFFYKRRIVAVIYDLWNENIEFC